jgi:hypothetical protein
MNLLDHIDGLAHSVTESAIWHDSGELLAEVETENQCDAAPDYVYELYCLFRIVSDLAKQHVVRLQAGFGNRKIRFPRKPAKKIGWPRYHVHDRVSSTLLLQVCAGTKVANMGANIERAPDISLQRAEASESPTEADLYCLYDAKLNEGKQKKGPE